MGRATEAANPRPAPRNQSRVRLPAVAETDGELSISTLHIYSFSTFSIISTLHIYSLGQRVGEECVRPPLGRAGHRHQLPPALLRPRPGQRGHRDTAETSQGLDMDSSYNNRIANIHIYLSISPPTCPSHCTVVSSAGWRWPGGQGSSGRMTS